MAENANIRIIIDAIAEAAEEALDDVGEEILDLGTDAGIAQGRLDEFGDEMNEASGKGALLAKALDEVQDAEEQLTVTSRLLRSAIDDVGDEMTEAAAKSSMAGGAFSSLAISTEGASLAMGTMSTVTTLSLIPSLMTLSTIIAPLVATLAVLTGGALALAGAFGAIVGSGILAFGEKRAEQNRQELQDTKARIRQLESLKQQTGSLTSAQQDQLEALRQEQKELEDATTAGGALKNVMGDLKEELVPLIVEFGEEFVPLISDAVDAIPELVESMIDAVGGTEEFRSALRDFGRVMMDVLPALTGLMFDLAREALPTLRDLANFMLGRGPEAAGAMKQSFEEIQPELENLLDALIEMSPVLLEFGTNVAEVVLPALTTLIRVATGFMETINDMNPALQDATISLLILLPALLKLGGAASSLMSLLGYSGLTGALSSLGAWLVGLLPSAFQLGVAFQTIVNGASAVGSAIAGSTAALAAIGAIIGLGVVKLMDMFGVLEAVREAGSDFADFFGKDATDAILTFLSVISLGIIPLLGALGGIIIGLVRGDLAGGVDKAEQILGTFGEAFKNTGSIIIGAVQSIAAGIWNWFVGGITSAGSAVWSVLTGLAQGFVQFFTQTLPGVVISGISFVIAFWESGMNRIHNLFLDVFQGIVNFGAQALETFLNTMIDHVNSWLSTIDDVANTVESVTGVNIGDVANLDQVDIQSRDLGGQRRETDVGELASQREEQMQTTINGGITVYVSNEQDLGQNPYRSSRTFGDQLRREIRGKQGT